MRSSSPTYRLQCVSLLLISAAIASAKQHSYKGSSGIVSNPERGFRQELHGACTGEGRVENGTIAKGLSLDEMSQACIKIRYIMALYNEYVL